MEIDAPSSSKAAAGGSSEECNNNNKIIKIHPLTIIGISDHHTRVISGGSALPRNAPVVGLLFGNQNIADNTISIVDAEEMEYPEDGNKSALSDSHKQNIVRKIDLHQKVFPKHVVVGWYRVHTGDSSSSSDNGDVVPTEDDLRMNQLEMAQYCGEGVVSPLFVLMNAASPEYTGVSDDNAKKSTSQNSELDDALPLTVYETLLSEGGGGGGSAFVNASFELETHEPERIAVEKVFNTQSSSAAASAQQKDSSSDKDDKKQQHHRDDKKDSSKPTYVRPPSELEVQLTSLQSSIRSMNVRMSILLEFLQKVERGELPPDNALLRSIDGLLQQLPLVLAALKEGTGSGGKKKKPLDELENDFTDTMLLSYLTAVAKTAKSVHVYSEKFHGAFGSGKSEIGRRTLY